MEAAPIKPSVPFHLFDRIDIHVTQGKPWQDRLTLLGPELALQAANRMVYVVAAPSDGHARRISRGAGLRYNAE